MQSDQICSPHWQLTASSSSQELGHRKHMSDKGREIHLPHASIRTGETPGHIHERDSEAEENPYLRLFVIGGVSRSATCHLIWPRHAFLRMFRMSSVANATYRSSISGRHKYTTCKPTSVSKSTLHRTRLSSGQVSVSAQSEAHRHPHADVSGKTSFVSTL